MLDEDSALTLAALCCFLCSTPVSSRHLGPSGWLAFAPQDLDVCSRHGLFLNSSRLLLDSILSQTIRVAAFMPTFAHSYMFSPSLKLLYVVSSLPINVLVSEFRTYGSHI